MPDIRLPKQKLYSEFCPRMKLSCIQMKTFKNLLKALLNKSNIPTYSWGSVAEDLPNCKRRH